MILKKRFQLSIALMFVLLASCGGGSSGSFTVGGVAFGLADGESVILQNNLRDNLTVSIDGGFTFSTQIANGAFYDVTILTKPSGKTCSVAHNEGYISGANVTNISVVCSTDAYTVGGIAYGLDSGDTLVVQVNLDDDLTITADGAFTFPTPLANGVFYDVTVLTGPTGKTCSVAHNEGTISGANVTDVLVICSAVTYTVSGYATGLSEGDTIALQLNLDDDLTVTSNSSFTFSTPLADGSFYDVTVLTAPTGKTCTISNNEGYIKGANISDVAVVCSNTTYKVGGTITADPAYGKPYFVVLQNNKDDELSLLTDGTFQFSTSMASGSQYSVRVFRNTTGKTCEVTNGSGTIGTSDVTDVIVRCLNTLSGVFLYESRYPRMGGKVGTRAETSATCETSYRQRSLALGCTNFVGLLGYTADNGVVDMPQNYGVPTDVTIQLSSRTLVASNWDNFINNKPPLSMTGTPDFEDYVVWSGFKEGGSLASDLGNCVEWSTAQEGILGAYANFYNELNDAWGDGGSSCAEEDFLRRFICMCW